MKSSNGLIKWSIFSAFLVVQFGGVAGLCAEEPCGKTLSPYFFVKADMEEGVEVLPLKSTVAKVDIAGVIADVRVTQVYRNEGKKTLEAIYVFPGSTRSAVYGMKMTIGERVRIAKIKERRTARAEYAKAKKEGKSASLLEQHRPNVFQMSVANILPGDEIQVELSYTELLVPERGVYEFVYPTVVGPRYSNQLADTAPQTEQWIANPYLREGEAPTSTFDLELGLNTGIPIQQVICPSHQVEVKYYDESQAAVLLADSEKQGGNRDYILKYRLQGEGIETGLLLYEGKEENFFLMMMQPPKRTHDEQIPPREYIYIIDVSGSMYGFPLTISKRLISDLISSLRPEDKFNVLLFAGGSSLMSEVSLPATEENIQRAIRHVDQQHGGGATELLSALERALKIPTDEEYSRTIVIATDGYVSIETEAFELIRRNLAKANVFAFGIGSSVNRYLIEGLARAGQGEPFVVTDSNEAPQTAARFREYIKTPVLTNIEVDYGDFEVYDVEPSSVPDILSQRPVVVFGKWRAAPRGTIAIKGNDGKGRYAHRFEVQDVKAEDSNSALRYLWARYKIAALSDYNQLDSQDERIQAITNLGLSYNLLTKYTSFIAVDHVVRVKDGDTKTVKQPLPLPKGVSNYAAGASVPTVPEPETYMMLGIAGIVLLWGAVLRRRQVGFGNL